MSAERMMDTVADQVLKQFAGNFATRVLALQAPSAAAAGPAPVEAPAPAAAPQLNAFALAWAVLRDWLRSLFGAKRA